jgi:hypothetical protein
MQAVTKVITSLEFPAAIQMKGLAIFKGTGRVQSHQFVMPTELMHHMSLHSSLHNI